MGQGVQSAVPTHSVQPCAVLYVPVSQARQAPPLRPEYPTLQVQLLSVDDCADEAALSGQFCTTPIVQYCGFTHAWQVAPPVPW